MLQRELARSLVDLEVRIELDLSPASEVACTVFDQAVAAFELRAVVAWIVLHSAVGVAVGCCNPEGQLQLLELKPKEMLAESALLQVRSSSAPFEGSASFVDSASFQHLVAFVMGGVCHN